MPPRTKQTFISIIGTHLYQPIAELISKLIARPYRKAGRVSSDFYESGYSAAVILLLAASVESLVQRDRYFYRTANPASKPSDKVHEYSKTILRYRRHRHLEEVFDVRHLIAHNHIWEIEVAIPSKGGLQHKRSQIVPWTHRLSSNKVPPSTTRIPRTQRLHLNLQPDRLDRTDVAKALAACLHFLDHLSKRGQRPHPLTTDSVGFKGKRLQFSSLLSEVKNAL